MNNRTKDISSSLLFLVLSGVGFLICKSKVDEGTTLSLHPYMMPMVILGFMTVLCVLRLILAVRMQKDKNDKAEKIITLKAALTLLMLIAYSQLFTRLGFVITSALYMFFQMLIIGSGKKNYLFMAILSIIGSVTVYIIFVYALSVMLPQGVLPI